MRELNCEIMCMERKGKLALVREEVVRESHTQASNSCAVLCCKKNRTHGSWEIAFLKMLNRYIQGFTNF